MYKWLSGFCFKQNVRKRIEHYEIKVDIHFYENQYCRSLYVGFARDDGYSRKYKNTPLTDVTFLLHGCWMFLLWLY